MGDRIDSFFQILESRLLRTAVVNDTDFSQQADLSAINITTAWKKTEGNLNVVAADIDTGIDYTSPDLFANIWINQDEIPPSIKAHLKDVDGDGRISFYDLNSKKNRKYVKDINGNGVIDAGDLLEPMKKGGWEDGIDEDGNGYVDDIIGWDFADNDNNPFDYVGHGSHTAGTIAATKNNDFGIAGIATTSLMIVKIFGDDGTGADEQSIADAIRYSADEGARVSNNSWGYTLASSSGFGFGGGGQTQDDPILDAISYAGTKGEIFVAAAGNDSVDNDFSYEGSYPASYDLDNIIAVAAVDNTGTLSYFSNFGANTVDLAAPGENVLSTWLDGGLKTESGTSMATPHVTGTIALMLARYPKLTIAEVKADLLASVDTSSSLSSALVSSGTLDAGAAVHLAATQRTAAIAAAAAASTSSITTASVQTTSVKTSAVETSAVTTRASIFSDSLISLEDVEDPLSKLFS